MPTPSSAPTELRVDLAAMRRRGIATCSVDAALPRAWLAQALHDTDAEVEGDASLQLQISLEPQGIVLVRGSLGLRLSVPCGRCLAPAAVDGSTSIFATFMASAAAAAALLREDDDALPPDPDTPDVWSYDGPVLDLEPMVAEQVALAYPMRALCERGQACRGLCSNCGHELNGLPAAALRCPGCGHEVPLTPVGDPPAEPDGGADEDRRNMRNASDEGESPLAAALRKLKLE